MTTPDKPNFISRFLNTHEANKRAKEDLLKSQRIDLQEKLLIKEAEKFRPQNPAMEAIIRFEVESKEGYGGVFSTGARVTFFDNVIQSTPSQDEPAYAQQAVACMQKLQNIRPDAFDPHSHVSLHEEDFKRLFTSTSRVNH